MRPFLFILLLSPLLAPAQKKFQLMALGGFVTHNTPTGVDASVTGTQNIKGYALGFQARYRGFRHIALGVGLDAQKLDARHPAAPPPYPGVTDYTYASPATSLYVTAEGVLQFGVLDIRAGIMAGLVRSLRGGPPVPSHYFHPEAFGYTFGGLLGAGVAIGHRWGIQAQCSPRMQKLSFYEPTTSFGEYLQMASFPVTLGISFRL